MKKSIVLSVLGGIVLVVVSLVLAFFIKVYYDVESSFRVKDDREGFVVGSAIGEHGEIKLQVKRDIAGNIKEIYVLEHPDNEIANVALQKLMQNSLDKQSSDEIDAVTSATETTEVFKKAIDNIVGFSSTDVSANESKDRISFDDPNVKSTIEPKVYFSYPNEQSKNFKSGIGAYVINSFSDAEYNKNGNLITHEYICAVVLNPNNRIENVRFDHISSNMNFDRTGKVPTGSQRYYTFNSDKNTDGFNGLTSDSYFLDVYALEQIVLSSKRYDDIEKRFGNNKAYKPYIEALKNAIDNARFVGAGDGDLLGLSAFKVLNKKDIINATADENGKVTFNSYYLLTTINKDNRISSCMLDNAENVVTLTASGRILGSRDNEIYTLNELSNTEKYSRIEKRKYDLKVEYNYLMELIRGNRMEDVINFVNLNTYDNGKGKDALDSFPHIDFINFVDLLARSYVDGSNIININ